jgi:hypothetical protein
MSHRAVARKYGFTHPVMDKHVNEHMGPALLEHNLSAPVLDQLRKLQRRTLAILEDAEREQDGALALDAIGHARRNLELMGRLTGELKHEEPHEPTRVEIVYVDKQLVVERAGDDKPPSLPPAA